MCLCVCEWMLHVYECLWRLEEGIEFFGAGVIDSCELPNVGLRKQSLEEKQEFILTAEPSLSILLL